jgi:D-alanyl-D-alanine carboxypeptidase
MLQTTDNHLADAVFRMLGAATGDPTWDGSAAAVEAALADIGADGVPFAWPTDQGCRATTA